MPMSGVHRPRTAVACTATRTTQQREQRPLQQQPPNRQHEQAARPLASSTPLVALCAAAAALCAAAGPASAAAAAADPLFTLAALSDVDPATAHSLETVLRPLFAIGTVLYIIRIPMTWYPSIDGTKLPWLVAYAPTEPILKATRKVGSFLGLPTSPCCRYWLPLPLLQAPLLQAV
jgi:hypothetical protein